MIIDSTAPTQKNQSLLFRYCAILTIENVKQESESDRIRTPFSCYIEHQQKKYRKIEKKN